MARLSLLRALARHRGLIALLALLWLAAQQGALWHPLQHRHDGAAASHEAHHGSDAVGEAGCGLCLALAALGAAAPMVSAITVARAPASAQPATPAAPDAATALPARHNRGPPAAG